MREHREVTDEKLLEENQVLLPRQMGLYKHYDLSWHRKRLTSFLYDS